MGDGKSFPRSPAPNANASYGLRACPSWAFLQADLPHCGRSYHGTIGGGELLGPEVMEASDCQGMPSVGRG